MASLTIYAISSALVLAVCFLIYKVGLAGATFHQFNRKVILSIYLLALAAPALMPWLGGWSGGEGYQAGDITFGMTKAIVADEAEPAPLWRMLPVAYASGLALALGFALYSIARISLLIKRGEKRDLGGAVLVTVDEAISPFSWWRWIVVPRNDANDTMVIGHELEHVRSLHSADLMLAQLMVAFNWFNPCAWMMRRELCAQHEYAVDEAMLSSGVDARSYQMLIVKKAVGSTMGPLANCLHNSQLKKRVKMMFKIKTKTVRRLFAAAILPAAIAASALVRTPAVATTLDQIKTEPANNGSIVTSDSLEIVWSWTADKANGVEWPEFKGGDVEMMRRLSEQVRYPSEAVSDSLQGRVIVNFVVDRNGNADMFSIRRSSGHEILDKEAIAACQRALSSGWIPGKKDGVPVSVNYDVPVTFRLK